VINGDTRYFFAGGAGSTQTIEIELGSTYTLDSFAGAFGGSDRTPAGPFGVEVSTDGTTFTPVTGTLGGSGPSGEYTLTAATPVRALYVLYNFGPPSPQYAYGGSGISQVFAYASPTPEPATWALFVLGAGGAGLMMRRARKAAPLTA
jgi:hypothetical protein